MHDPHDIKGSKSISGLWYVLSGLAVGTAAGLLFAPKKGSEAREDVEAWGRRNGERARALLARVRGIVPQRAKTGSVRSAHKQGVRGNYAGNKS